MKGKIEGDKGEVRPERFLQQGEGCGALAIAVKTKDQLATIAPT